MLNNTLLVNKLRAERNRGITTVGFHRRAKDWISPRLLSRSSSFRCGTSIFVAYRACNNILQGLYGRQWVLILTMPSDHAKKKAARKPVSI